MDMPKSKDKPFAISKREVWEAYQKVKANKGAAGVDAVSLGEFESDLKNNLYVIWNRMSSGSYFPPPVRAVPIPKDGGRGVRVLGGTYCRRSYCPDRGSGTVGGAGGAHLPYRLRRLPGRAVCD